MGKIVVLLPQNEIQMLTTASLSLHELNALVRDVIDTHLDEEYWVTAELSEIREVRGHCYMELIQKDEHSHTPIAKASAKCWANTWQIIRPHFERVTGQTMHVGLKVMLRVRANFHEAYGFSWIVSNIDATFTLGDMARKRMEIIAKLKSEGVFDLQKQLAIPMFALRIAVISSENAAGYGDFSDHLMNNDYGFAFATTLFPAIMQGERVESSIIAALNKINASTKSFDAVVIIRGGGATSDLSGFDTLTLAENVANFPLPIITGIGHERDESVLDMISNTQVKTPTAAADLLIDNLAYIYNKVEMAQDVITNSVRRRIENENVRINTLSNKIPMLFSVVETRQTARLDSIFYTINTAVKHCITAKYNDIELLGQRAEAQNPQRLLKRGYSITLHNGKALRNVTRLKAGDEIETRVAEGAFKSIIK